MANTPVDICNLALSAIGESPISSLTDENKRARTCNQVYADMRDAVLAEHPWNFAIGRQVLAASATAPDFGWAYAYPKPADCLRALDIASGERWQEEGGYIMTDYTTVKLRYIRREENVAKYNALFVQALKWRIAMEIAEPLAQDKAKAGDAADAYELAMSKARTADAKEGHPDERPAGSWNDARMV